MNQKYNGLIQNTNKFSSLVKCITGSGFFIIERDLYRQEDLCVLAISLI